MRAPPNERAAPDISGNGSLQADRLAGAIYQRDTESRRQVQELRRRAVRLRHLTAKLDALADWKADLQHRIAVAEEKLHADGNLYFSRLYPDEIDDLIDAIAAWRLTAARVVVDLVHQDDMRSAA